jgi:hypothetical protein
MLELINIEIGDELKWIKKILKILKNVIGF